MVKINILKAREELKNGKSIFDLNLRVVYYGRVSTESDEQLNSLSNQINFFEDYVANAPNWELVNRYIDEGISGTQVKNRVSFMRMIEDAKMNKFDMILTKEVSRFARNTIDSIKYTDDLLKMGVVVFFLNDNLNTIDETCEFRLTIMSSLAQDEVRKLSSRVKFGMARSVKDGRVLGGGNLTGYNKSNGKLTINEEEAGMIKMLFDLYATGKYGFRIISDKLFDAGYKTIKNGRYAESTLARMLQNPKYKGFYCGNKSYIVDYKTHRKVRKPKSEWLVYKDPNIPAIVTEEVWDRANEIFNKRHNDFYANVSNKNLYNPVHHFSGKFVCKEHNKHFTRLATGQRKNNPVWQCLEYARHGLKCCETPTLFEKHITEIFKCIIGEFKLNGEKLLNELISDYSLYIENSVDKKRISVLEEKITRIEMYKDKLLELNVDGSISNNEFKTKNDKYNLELEDLIKELDYLNSFEITKEQKELRLKELKKSIKKIINNDESFADLFNLLVKKVYVSKINNNRKHIKLEIIFNDGFNNKLIEMDLREKNSPHFYGFEYRIPNANGTRGKCYSDTTNNSSFFYSKWWQLL